MGMFDLFKSSGSPVTVQKAATREQQRFADSYMKAIYKWFGNDQPIDGPHDGKAFVRGYQTVGAVYTATSLILNKLAACPIVVYEVKDEQQLKKYNNFLQGNTIESKARGILLKSRVLEEVSQKEIQAILDKPNESQSISDIIEEMAGALILNGNSYTYRNGPNPEQGKFSEIYTLPAHETQPISGGMFNPVKGYQVSYSDELIPALNVIHAKTYNPDWSNTGAQLMGQSPFRAMLNKMNRIEFGDKEVNKQLKNGGTFGVVAPKNEADYWTKEQGDAFKEKLRMSKQSEDELNRIHTTAVPLDFIRIGLSIADLQLLELLKLTDEQIYRALHIPLQYLNQEGSTFNNKSEAGKELIYNALDPVSNRIEQALTRAICDPVSARAGKRYIINIDTSSLPEMAADMKEIAEWCAKSPELTYNEIREIKGFGKLELPNMDTPFISKNFVPIEMAGVDTAAFTQGIEEEQEKEPKV